MLVAYKKIKRDRDCGGATMKKFIPLVFVISVFLCLPGQGYSAMEDYFAVPPFCARAVSPNILLLIDVTGSMLTSAYTPLVNDYDGDREYYGYFKTDKFYKYDAVAGKFVENGHCSWWDRDHDHDWGPEKIPGNLLNWATMSRINILLKVLTGGKSEPESDQYNPETLVSVNYAGQAYYGNCRFVMAYPDILAIQDNGGCVFGSLADARQRVDVPERAKSGVIQHISDKDSDGVWDDGAPRFGLMVYTSGKEGCMRAGIGSATVSEVLIAAQREAVGGNTPTGEALQSALRYYGLGSTFSNPTGCPEAWPGQGEDPWCDWCRKSFILLVSDGEWNMAVDPARPAREGRIQDRRPNLKGHQAVLTYTVFAFSNVNSGKNALKWTAMMGSFEDQDSDTWPDPCYYYPSDSRTASLPASNAEWDLDGDGVPDNYFEAQEGAALEESLLTAIYGMLQKAASGTGASVISGQTESGTGLIQALFFPQRVWVDGEKRYRLDWTGSLYNWWLYRGTEVANINMREDTAQDKELNLAEDYLIEFDYDDDESQLYLKAYADADSDGVPDNPSNPVAYDNLSDAHFLWEAGEELSTRSETSRKVYTQVNGEDLIRFQSNKKNDLEDYLGDDLGIDCTWGGYDCSYEELIMWVRGIDTDGCRSRKVMRSPRKTWCLGDIAYSSPQVVSYDDYTVAFVGANDGMLHAFQVGYYNRNIADGVVKIQNSDDNTGSGNLGKELWAFIPKNALPYLRYLANVDYSHIYSVDLTPYVVRVDYDNDNTKEKVLIGGMRLGGAVGCSAAGSVNPPDDASGAGKSSYFALDVTDPDSPELLWEFTHNDLGFSYSGPGVVKKGNDYYVVFLSGPTNYDGESGQNLKIFVIDLSDGSLEHTIDTGIPNAFGGRLFTYTEGGPLYFGYAKQGSWTGGILKLDTSDTDPANWGQSSVRSVISGIGPVIATIKAADFGANRWLFFGEGRYFTPDDDLADRRYLYGIKASCEDLTRAGLVDQTSAVTGVVNGWYIQLDAQSGSWGAERAITDAMGVKTGSNKGEVYFISFQPTTEVCEFGGRTFMWRVDATTGGAVDTAMPGKIFVQVSTGQIKGYSDSNMFTGMGGRKSGALAGVPGEQSPQMVTLESWQGNIIHWVER